MKHFILPYNKISKTADQLFPLQQLSGNFKDQKYCLPKYHYIKIKQIKGFEPQELESFYLLL
ncbi:protein of unknown function [Ruminococcaceae bacterium BL-4]|nr:protein of unknown function [Ruminococcaceae bacterium BL-4]